jgi:tryptophan halogenase
VIPEGHDMRADAPSAESLIAGMRKLAGEVQAIAGGMEEHGAYLQRYCPMKEAA